MAEYLPFRGKHSIQEAQINILFLGPFEQQSIQVTMGFAQSELSAELPRSAEVRGGSFRIDITNPAAPSPMGEMQTDVAGFQISKAQPNGQPARILQLANNALSVSFMDYESWDAAKCDALRYLHPVLISLPLEQIPAVAIGLRFIDRYTFSGNPDDARPDLLLMRKNPHITPHTFDSGATWHCNTGWFENPIEEGDRVLHNLNASSSLVNLSSTVTIDHNATRHLGSLRYSIDTLSTPADGAIGLTDALEGLHNRNKEILAQVLFPEMLRKIGITNECLHTT